MSDCPRPTSDPLDPACLPGRVALFVTGGVANDPIVRSLATGRTVIVADPARPLFGPPGALARGVLDADGAWRLDRLEALASLDVVRYRAAALVAAARLDVPGPLLVVAPAIVRGVAGAELAAGLVSLLHLDAVLRHPGPPAAPADRDAAWTAWLADAQEHPLRLDQLTLLGRADPPPHWSRWLVGVLDDRGATLAVGETRGADGPALVVAAPPFPTTRARTLVIRDAARDGSGHLATVRARPAAGPPPPRDPHGGLVLRRGGLTCTLYGGVFDDPLLLVRPVRSTRTVCVDLGAPLRLPNRLAHRITDLCLTHAHLDHFSGFLWLLRARMGLRDTIRVHGPPGIANRLASFIEGFTWDRLDDPGPSFDVAELQPGGTHVLRRYVEAGIPEPEDRGEEVLPEPGLLLDDGTLRIEAAVLDHRGLPVVAYAISEPAHAHVRPDALAASGLASGPWLGELRERARRGDLDGTLTTPDGATHAPAELAARLFDLGPGHRVVYATDLGDTPGNRGRLAELARGASVLFCESAFRTADADRAAAAGHLTTDACARVATAAGVDELIPFHFSRRYEREADAVWSELLAGFDRVRRHG